MIEFLIMIAVLVICGLLFGKADTKKELLNQVGLDLCEESYKNQKKREFRKYSIKAMNAIVELDYYKARDENEFLNFMSSKLHIAVHGDYEFDDIGRIEYSSLYLAVKKNYIRHAARVIQRRIDDIKAGNNLQLSKGIIFYNKNSAKRYCAILWEKYQYPWPNDWLQTDRH